MEKNVDISITKDNGLLWKWYNDVPRSSFRIEDGFVIIDLGKRVHMFPIHRIERIDLEEV